MLKTRLGKQSQVALRGSQRNRGRAARVGRRPFDPSFDILEDRILMSTVTWVGGSGDWATATNWKDDALVNRLPGPDDDAVIDVAGISVTHSTGSDTVKSLTVNDPFTLSDGTLTVAGNLVQQNGNLLTQTGGTLKSATVVGGGGPVLLVLGGTLDGVTLGATVSGIPAPAIVETKGPGFSDNAIVVTGGLTFVDGSIVDLAKPMYLDGDQTLGGDGELIARAATSLNIYGQITFGAGLTVHLADPDSTLDIYMGTSDARVTNHGTIRAAAGGFLAVDPDRPGSLFTNAADGVLSADDGSLELLTPWTNAGQIVVHKDGTLQLSSSYTTDDIGSVTRTGGTILLSGQMDNTGRTF